MIIESLIVLKMFFFQTKHLELIHHCMVSEKACPVLHTRDLIGRFDTN